ARHPDHIADVLAGLAFLRRLLHHHHQPSDGHDHDHGGSEKASGPRTAANGSSDAARPRRRQQQQQQQRWTWILAGHSCGATLAFQSVMDPTRWGLAGRSAGAEPTTTAAATAARAAAIVGFNGLYDLAGFVAAPPAGYAHLRDAYREFVTGAFGPDRPLGGGFAGLGIVGRCGAGRRAKRSVWTAVCPATAEGPWVDEWLGSGSGSGSGSSNSSGSGGGGGGSWWWWKRGRAANKKTKEEEEEEEEEDRKKTTKGVVVLVQSREDTLVPWQQLEAMRQRLERERRRVDVRVLEGAGDHDDVWREGSRMAQVLWQLAEEL
ncbi:hypothetical protein VTH06DRAFT_1019, partial [Thermothelomyces fergusii]